MNDFKDEYRNLKDSINSDNSKIVSFLVLGVLLGRLIEKFYNLKKRLRRKKWTEQSKIWWKVYNRIERKYTWYSLCLFTK